MGVMLLALVFLLTRYGSLMVSGQAAAIGRERPSVVIDVGHGGNDPGKVGVDKSLELSLIHSEMCIRDRSLALAWSSSTTCS